MPGPAAHVGAATQPSSSDVSIAIVGGGLTGILMGIEPQRSGLSNFTLYEQASGLGGTWLRNSYSGPHCDVPSHLYCYSFEPNPSWSQVYASRDEILDSFQTCAAKYGLLDHVRFNSRVDLAKFDEASGA